ncbi:MAG: hypothetical protein ACREYE_12645, partial [Gammaproteobacteria bacterium]
DIIKKIERARVKMEQIKPRSTLPRGKKEGGLTVKLFKEHYTSFLLHQKGLLKTLFSRLRSPFDPRAVTSGNGHPRGQGPVRLK